MNAKAVRHIEFPRTVRRDGHAGGISAVVGITQGDDVVVARVEPRHEKGEVVGFGAGIHEIADLEIARKLGRQLFGVFGNFGLQINRGRMLDGLVLFVRRLHDMPLVAATEERLKLDHSASGQMERLARQLDARLAGGKRPAE